MYKNSFLHSCKKCMLYARQNLYWSSNEDLSLFRHLYSLSNFWHSEWWCVSEVFFFCLFALDFRLTLFELVISKLSYTISLNYVIPFHKKCINVKHFHHLKKKLHYYMLLFIIIFNICIQSIFDFVYEINIWIAFLGVNYFHSKRIQNNYYYYYYYYYYYFLAEECGWRRNETLETEKGKYFLTYVLMKQNIYTFSNFNKTVLKNNYLFQTTSK